MRRAASQTPCEHRDVTSDDALTAVLAEQVDYYTERSSEYDQWFFRQGRYDRGRTASDAWFSEVEVVRAALAELPIDRAEVLELAPGTGLWTELLVGRAAHVTAVDASPAMIEQNRHRLAASSTSSVSFVCADLFEWEPNRTFDAVVFCFWISHVPEIRLDRFLRMVSRALKPGGCLFFVDGLREPTSTASDHVLEDSGELMTRRLDDGRVFTIVKSYRSRSSLQEQFAAAGLDVDVQETATYFQYGLGHRPDAR
jgi:ubiquinone/menaquinone biosynthesis C-methylase UbiE